MERRLDVHGEGGNQLEQLCVVAVPAPPPTDQVKVQFLFQFLRHQRVPNEVDQQFDVIDDLWHDSAQGGACGRRHFDGVQYLPKYF